MGYALTKSTPEVQRWWWSSLIAIDAATGRRLVQEQGRPSELCSFAVLGRPLQFLPAYAFELSRQLKYAGIDILAYTFKDIREAIATCLYNSECVQNGHPGNECLSNPQLREQVCTVCFDGSRTYWSGTGAVSAFTEEFLRL